MASKARTTVSKNGPCRYCNSFRCAGAQPPGSHYCSEMVIQTWFIPYCKADAGEHCKNPRTGAWRLKVHAERHDLWKQRHATNREAMRQVHKLRKLRELISSVVGLPLGLGSIRRWPKSTL